MNIARIGVLLDRKVAERRHQFGINVFEGYIEEILSHGGFPYKRMHTMDSFDAEEWDVIIVALSDDSRETYELLWNFADQGGVIIAYGGLNRWSAKLNCTNEKEVGVGYAIVPELWDKANPPIRGLKANPWTTLSPDPCHVDNIGLYYRDRPNSSETSALLQHFQVGKGLIARWAVPIPQFVVQFQQGLRPILEDGIPAPDGSATLDEGLLKADDSMAVDWELDRKYTETGEPYFAYPYADWWREVLISHILQQVTNRGWTLPFVDYWPDGVSSVAMISHDSDHNVDEHAETTLQVLEENQVRSTWCMMEEGYSEKIYDKVKQDGHELAFHYNALPKDNGFWDEFEFNRQLNALKSKLGGCEIISNKNHYTLFEGWDEFFEWCERAGIELDQTRGHSKKGNIGYLFGTCHPYFPMAWSTNDNRMFNVLEVGFLTQDLDLSWLNDSSVVVPFLEEAMRVRGVAHFLFHQLHLHQSEAVRQALAKVVKEARSYGFVFWTSQEMNTWERSRRQLSITGLDHDGQVVTKGPQPAQTVVVWVPVKDQAHPTEKAEYRFGVWCIKQLLQPITNERKVGVLK